MRVTACICLFVCVCVCVCVAMLVIYVALLPQSVLNSLRVTKDITTVKQEATILSEQMQLVKEDITRVSG